MNYASVINTAKNGQLTRSELRELVLAMALINGFYVENGETSMEITPVHKSSERDERWADVFNSYAWVTEVLKSSYRYQPEENGCIIFTDPKFRIYRQRLEYGFDHSWRLRENTMRYLWTRIPLLLFFAFCSCRGLAKLDFSNCTFANFATDLEENMRAVSSYISSYGYRNDYYPKKDAYSLYFHESIYETLYRDMRDEAAQLKQKLYNGCYIDQKPENIEEEYDYGKKSREFYKTLISRKIKENSCAD